MGASTEISWTDSTFNTHWGCQVVSPACDSCYAKAWSERVGHGKSLPVIWGGASTERRFFGDKHWVEPLKWNRIAGSAGDRRRVFCSSMADVFEDRRDLDPVRVRLRQTIAQTPYLDWQLLTKRPHVVARLWGEASTSAWPAGTTILWEDAAPAWPSNVWLGTTVEDRKFGLPRIDVLRNIPARTRFLSCEPLLEDLGDLDLSGIHWVISGGESGRNPRPYDLAWARRLRDQCKEKGVAYFHKQLGANPIDASYPGGRVEVGDRKHGAIMEQFPTDLRIREFPSVE